MDPIRVLVALAFCILLFIHQGAAIKCHICNSAREGDSCSDIVGDAHSEECPAEKTMCRKMTQNVEGDERVIRQCALPQDAACVERTGTYKIKVKYCHCNGDNCNTASQTFSPSKLLLVLPVALLAAFRL